VAYFEILNSNIDSGEAQDEIKRTILARKNSL
jgi:hypothetical protein